MRLHPGVLIWVVAFLVAGCRSPSEELSLDAFVEEDGPAAESDGPQLTGDGPLKKQDKGGATKKDLGGVKKDSNFVPPDSGPAGSIKVAAVQYGPGMYTYVPGGCKTDLCALSQLITEAKNNGAQYVVTPEYGADQQTVEWSPALGDKPVANTSKWPAGSIINTFCALSDSLNIHVIFNVQAQEGSGSTASIYNTDVVCDPSGAVIARHYKYYLYGEQGLTAGTNCCDYFTTPAGKAGLLICADINCIIALDASASSCTAAGLKKMNDFVAGKPHLVFFSSFWAATGSSNTAWRPINVQSKFAKYANAYVAAANIITSKYHGGGVYKPDGTPIQTACDYGTTVGTTCKPTVVYGVVPP